MNATPTSTSIQDSETNDSAPHPIERREFFKSLTVGLMAGASLPLLRPPLASAADSDGKAKVVFVLFRRSDLTHEQCVAEWIGDTHVTIVKKVAGLKKWVQNHAVAPPNAT